MRLRNLLKTESTNFTTRVWNYASNYASRSILHPFDVRTSRLKLHKALRNRKSTMLCKLFRKMNVINIARSSVAGFSRRRVSLAQLLEREIEHIGMKEKRRRDSPAGLRHPTARACWERTWWWLASLFNWWPSLVAFNPSSDADSRSDQARHLSTVYSHSTLNTFVKRSSVCVRPNSVEQSDSGLNSNSETRNSETRGEQIL